MMQSELNIDVFSNAKFIKCAKIKNNNHMSLPSALSTGSSLTSEPESGPMYKYLQVLQHSGQPMCGLQVAYDFAGSSDQCVPKGRL